MASWLRGLVAEQLPWGVVRAAWEATASVWLFQTGQPAPPLLPPAHSQACQNEATSACRGDTSESVWLTSKHPWDVNGYSPGHWSPPQWGFSKGDPQESSLKPPAQTAHLLACEASFSSPRCQQWEPSRYTKSILGPGSLGRG